MSHCGPWTTNFLESVIVLRTCTPLLPFSLTSLTLNVSSKSVYFCFEQKKVLNPGSLSALPTTAVPWIVQNCLSPSQFSGLRNSVVSSARAVLASRTAARERVNRRMARTQKF